MIYPYGVIFEGSFKNDREDCGTKIWLSGKKLTIGVKQIYQLKFWIFNIHEKLAT
jgi:hypothetical protein